VCSATRDFKDRCRGWVRFRSVPPRCPAVIALASRVASGEADASIGSIGFAKLARPAVTKGYELTIRTGSYLASVEARSCLRVSGKGPGYILRR
jgi:hypothetical protein